MNYTPRRGDVDLSPPPLAETLLPPQDVPSSPPPPVAETPLPPDPETGTAASTLTQSMHALDSTGYNALFREGANDVETEGEEGADTKGENNKGVGSKDGEEDDVDMQAVLSHVRHVFRRLDKNSDGAVSRSELVKGIRSHEEVSKLLGLNIGSFKQGSDGHTAFETVVVPRPHP